MEDILLSLLIFNVENKNKWIRKDLLKLKLGDEIDAALNILQSRNFIECKEEYIRITKNGIEYIVERV